MSANAGIEVLGNVLCTILSATGNMPLVNRLLAQHGLPQQLNPNEWYDRDRTLGVLSAIFASTGPATIRAIGQQIPARAEFPPNVQSIDEALKAINIAYHLNHRKNGQVMFDAASGRMTDGIGHYTAAKAAKDIAQVTVQSPYPCQFDMGIVEAIVDRFKNPASPWVAVKHRSHAACRSRGASACIYVADWSGQ